MKNQRTGLALAVLLATLFSAVNSLGTTHEVGRGESLYSIVAIHYPQDMNNWTGIAAQLVELNPEVLTQGMDTALQPGMVLRLLDETNNSAPPPVFGNRSKPSVEATDAPLSDTSSTTPEPDGSDAANAAERTARQAQVNSTGSSAPRLSPETKHQIGSIKLLTGAVTLQRQNESLQPIEGDALFAGDELRTSKRSSLSVAMTDQTVYRLAANTVVNLEDYLFESSNGKGHAIITLVRGVLQVQSGELAAADGNQLSVNTVIATITIKGTEFALAMCSASNCDRNGLDINAGLYSGVVEGTIRLQNNTGSRVSSAGEFLHIASVNSEAEAAPHVAPLLFSQEQLDLMAAAQGDEPLGFIGWLLSLFGGD